MPTVRWQGPDGYWVSDDHALIDVDLVHRWMCQESYWAAGRPREVMARSIENSLTLGLYTAGGDQVGFARLVTDRATFAWLCDVFVAADHRGGELSGANDRRPSRRRRDQATADGRARPESVPAVWLRRPRQPRAVDGAPCTAGRREHARRRRRGRRSHRDLSELTLEQRNESGTAKSGKTRACDA